MLLNCCRVIVAMFCCNKQVFNFCYCLIVEILVDDLVSIEFIYEF